ncbi:hypothetical protein, partial [Sphingobacterium kyonggiense]
LSCKGFVVGRAMHASPLHETEKYNLIPSSNTLSISNLTSNSEAVSNLISNSEAVSNLTSNSEAVSNLISNSEAVYLLYTNLKGGQTFRCA